ncbi:NAD(P)H-dependent oxidoreductase [Pseudomonas putida]|uniref:NAD(P)H-dependent oxidoreductase n=1 Tax=Pseudomonas TaxID=286 RepID=UPI0015BBA274|nr:MULTISPECIES: NAD(P)H-dependent oxidoreductase [Pseudomonas]MDH4846251.1 NAD(P)H-dependent oxidoreductase [Pseudomonas sp. BN605]MDH4858540.1 NAD(P)H-dependent oxidoreductase [Pseudomonas sp. BN505]NWL07980.1 NAD(P)H dehydrogenase [Pseudomonas hunanensis]
MNVLIVHAHPEPQSFTSSLYADAVEYFSQLGHKVETSDLYAMNFNPVASSDDFKQRTNPDYLVYALEQRNAAKYQQFSSDIANEVDKVLRCDLLILTFPIYWFSMPAILKGWIDRVFISGTFYGGRRVFGDGGMVGKKALVCATLGGREGMFGQRGIHGDLQTLLRPLLKGSLGYVGFDVLAPFVGFHIPYLSTDERKLIQLKWREALATLSERKQLLMPNLSDYDENFSLR